MAYKTDPGMALVMAWMPRPDADVLTELAHSRGISRSALLRQAARELIEQHGEREHQWTTD